MHNEPCMMDYGTYILYMPVSLKYFTFYRHVGENAEVVIIKNAGHAINAEKPKEMYKHIKSFLIDPLPLPPHKQDNNSYGGKMD